MKTLIRTIKLATVFWLSFVVLIDAKTVSELVICVGQNGHLALETAFDNPIDLGSPSCDQVCAIASFSEPSHCGKCVDLAVSAFCFDQGVPGKSTASGDTGVTQALVIVVAILPREKPESFLFLEAPKPPSRILASVRSVVILV